MTWLLDLVKGHAVTAGGYVLAGFLFWLLLEAREDLGEEREQCNSDKLAAVAAAEEALRNATIDSYEERIQQLEKIAADEVAARAIAEQAAIEAAARPAEVREIIREVASENSCIDTAVPDAVLDSLRE